MKKTLRVAGLLGLVGVVMVSGYLAYSHLSLTRAVRAGDASAIAQRLEAVPVLFSALYTERAVELVTWTLISELGPEALDPLLRPVLTRQVWRKALQARAREWLAQRRYSRLASLVSTPSFVRHGGRGFFRPLVSGKPGQLIDFLDLVGLEPGYHTKPGWQALGEWYRACGSPRCVWRLGELLAEPQSPLAGPVALQVHIARHRGTIPAAVTAQPGTPTQQYLQALLTEQISTRESTALLREAAEAGHVAARWALFARVEPGSREAEALLREAADAGHPFARTLMAVRSIAEGDTQQGLALLEGAARQGFTMLWPVVGAALLEGESLYFPSRDREWLAAMLNDPLRYSTTLPRAPALGLRWLREGVERGEADAAQRLYHLQDKGKFGLDPTDHHALAKYALIMDASQGGSHHAGSQAAEAIRKARPSVPELLALAEQWHPIIEASDSVARRWVEELREPEYQEVLLAVARRHGQPVRMLHNLVSGRPEDTARHPAFEHLLGRINAEQLKREPTLMAHAAAFAPLAVVRRLVERGAPVNVAFTPEPGSPRGILQRWPMPDVPLLAAIYKSRLPVVQYLLEQGADVNAGDASVNAVSVALNRSYPRMVHLFWKDPRFTHRSPKLEARVRQVLRKWRDWFSWSENLEFTFLDASGQELGPDAPPQRRQCVRDLATGLTWVIPTGEPGPFAATRAIHGGSPEDNDCNKAYCPMPDFQAEVKAKRPCGIGVWRFPDTRELSTLTFPGYRRAFPAWPHPHLWVRIDDGRLGIARVDDLFGQRPPPYVNVRLQWQPPTSALLVSGKLAHWPPPLDDPQDYETYILE